MIFYPDALGQFLPKMNCATTAGQTKNTGIEPEVKPEGNAARTIKPNEKKCTSTQADDYIQIITSLEAGTKYAKSLFMDQQCRY